MSAQYLQAVQQNDQRVNAVLKHLGVTVDDIAPGQAELRMTAKSELTQGAGVLSGGVLATLLDETMAHAVLTQNEAGQRTCTVDMHVTYYRVAKVGDDLICRGYVTKRGKRMVFVDAVASCNDKEIAKSTASFMLF